MRKDARHPLAGQRIGHEDQRDDGKRPAQRPAGALQQRDDENTAKNDVGRRGGAAAESELVQWNERHMRYGEDGSYGQQSVVDRDAERTKKGVLGRRLITALADGEIGK